MGKMFSVEQIANKFQVHKRTVRRWIKTGQLSAYKVGRQWRVPEKAIEDFIKSGPGEKEEKKKD